jgi:Uma2 family endonuclease
MNAIFTPPTLPEYDLPDVPEGFELIDGELVEMPEMSEEASWIAVRILTRLDAHAEANRLGRVYGGDTAFRCFPGQKPTVRKPDVAFVRREKLADRPSRRDLRVPPDLAVEVISPNDLVYDLDRKIEQYLSVDVRLIWVVNPDIRTVILYRLDGSVARLRAEQELNGEDVLPGFRCRIDAFLPPPAPPADSPAGASPGGSAG